MKCQPVGDDIVELMSSQILWWCEQFLWEGGQTSGYTARDTEPFTIKKKTGMKKNEIRSYECS